MKRLCLPLVAALLVFAACEGPPVGEGEGDEGEGDEGEGDEGEGDAGEGEGDAGEGEGEGEGACPAVFDAAIDDCVTDVLADSGGFVIDALVACADAEPIADDRDAYCAVADDVSCDLSLEDFVTDVLPECRARVQEARFADVCVFPDDVDDVAFAPGLALLDRRVVRSANDASPTDAAQIADAAGVSFDVALQLADGDGWQLTHVLEVAGDREIVFVTARQGGADVDGAAYFFDTVFRVATVSSGVVGGCAVEVGLEGRVCDAREDCDGVNCEGIVREGDTVIADGVCAPPQAGGGDACLGDNDCSAGFVCALFGFGADSGDCQQAWRRGSFRGDDDVKVLPAGGTVRVPLVVHGLATVPSRFLLDLRADLNAESTLTVTLENPSGTRTAGGTFTGTAVHLDGVDVPVLSDEGVNGVWFVEVFDVGGSSGGGVVAVSATIDSRFD